jgi:hypothetical protein
MPARTGLCNAIGEEQQSLQCRQPKNDAGSRLVRDIRWLMVNVGGRNKRLVGPAGNV